LSIGGAARNRLVFHTAFCRTVTAMPDSARLEARLPIEVHALLKQAAELEGRTLTDFVVSAAQAAARRTLEEHSMLRLCLEDQQRLAEALFNPPEPTPALRRAFQRQRKLLGDE
jgi:uncharacterized protein (DUF1778 family)